MVKEMGRAPCCEKVGLKRGRWTEEEDENLKKYILSHGEGSWRSLPRNAGLQRCGKSCRLRWINYLRSDVKRGNITPQEEEIIVNLHATLGNRWSSIARHLPARTDNEIKNYWNSHLSRKIYSFRHPNPNFIAPPVAAVSSSKTNRQASRSTARKNKNLKNIQKQSQQPNIAVSMPTIINPEKPALSNPKSSSVDEKLQLNESENLSLDDFMADVSQIWDLDDKQKKEYSVSEDSGFWNGNFHHGVSNDSWNEISNQGSSENNYAIYSNVNSREWLDWDETGEMIENTAWGRDDDTFSWPWDVDNGESDYGGVQNGTESDEHSAILAWLMS